MVVVVRLCIACCCCCVWKGNPIFWPATRRTQLTHINRYEILPIDCEDVSYNRPLSMSPCHICVVSMPSLDMATVLPQPNNDDPFIFVPFFINSTPEDVWLPFSPTNRRNCFSTLYTHTHTARHSTIRLITLLWFGSCRWRSIYCVQHGVCVWSNARVPRHFWVYYILLLLFERDTIYIRWAHGVSEWMANIHSFNVAVTNRSKLDR